ncbi:exonuclease domain-containing protein [Gorillibacterium sp. sgz5001074]|uniref:exonuclease domain-containing protein n=1 Tax=Gorillibacterium sp. sgz5001074 TaxID=3446695 RepID=UPI003F678422
MKDTGPAGRMWQLYKMGGITPAITSMFDARNAQQMAFIRSVMKEQRKNSLYDVQLETMEAVVFDLETTGFSPYNGDEILSIGAIQIRGGVVSETQEDRFYSLVNPRRNVPIEITELTGITNEMVEQAPELIDGLRGFLEFVQRRVLIAHGSGHDKHFLNSALWKTSKVNLSHRVLDTMMIAMWLHPKRGRYDLDAILDLYGVEVLQRHHALDDSIMTARLWSKMLVDIREKGISNLGELYAHLSHYGS